MNTSLIHVKRPDTWFQKPIVIISITIGVSLIYGISIAASVSPLILLAIPVALFVAVLAIIRPEYAAVALLVIEWGYISDIAIKYHGLPSISKPLVGFLAGMLVLRRFAGQRKPWVSDRTTWWMLTYLAVIALGLWYAKYPERTLVQFVDFAKEFVIYLVFINLISTIKTFRTAIWLLLGICALLGSITAYQEITQNYSSNFGGLANMKIAQISEGLADRPRAGGSIGEPLAYGQQLLVLLPVGFWAILQSRTKLGRGTAIYATAAILSGIGLSFSRSTYIGAVVVVALYALHIKLNPRYLLWLLPLLLGLLYIAPSAFTARFATLANLFGSEGVRSEASYERRSVEMIMAFNMFVDYPILGVGGMNYRVLYPQYIREYGSPVPDEQRDPHNFYLEVAAEHGIVGLIPWFGILVMVWSRLRSAQRNFKVIGDTRMSELAAALQFGFIGYLVTAMFFHGVFSQYLWMQVGIAVALSLIAKRLVEQKKALAAA